MVLICWIAYLPAQDAIRLVYSWNSDTASVGEPVVLRLEAELPKGTIPHFPEPLLEDRNVSLISTHLEPMAVEYTFTFWELGRIILPGIPVKIVDADGVEKVAATDSMSIVVTSVLTGGEQDIREIKEMVPLRLRNIRSFWLRVGIMAIVMGVFAILWRTRRNLEITHPDPGKSLRPHIVVQRRLKELRSAVYDPEGAGDFYLKLSQILRQYLEQRYLFRALEMTTSEIKGVLPSEIDDEITVSLIGQVLEDSDLAKFANQHLSATQWTEDLSKLEDILEYTRPTFNV
jgi:hypothetical protein